MKSTKKTRKLETVLIFNREQDEDRHIAREAFKQCSGRKRLYSHSAVSLSLLHLLLIRVVVTEGLSIFQFRTNVATVWTMEWIKIGYATALDTY